MGSVEGVQAAGCDEVWRWMDFVLKWQQTAAEKGSFLKFDSNSGIGSWKSWHKLVGLTERMGANIQLIKYLSEVLVVEE